MARSNRNKLWFTLHGWMGVQFGLMLFVILFSGSLATVADELDWLANPAMRVVPPSGTQPVGLSAMADAVHQRYPGHDAWFIHLPANPAFAVEFQVLRPGDASFTERVRRVYVNPYTAEVQGESGWLTIQRALRNFHMNLSLPAFGIYVVSAFAIPLLVSVVTALLFYKRWWRRFFVLRTTRGRRVLWSDVHRLIGLWSVWFTVLIALTGIWYLTEMAMLDAGAGLTDVPIEAPHASAPAGRKRASLDALADAARAAYPELDIRTIRLPDDPTAAVRIHGDANTVLVRDRANNVYVDPYSAEVLAVVRGDELPAAHRWVHTADPLHFGDFGGLISKLIWCIFGLGASALVLTGTWLWAQRITRIPQPRRSRTRITGTLP